MKEKELKEQDNLSGREKKEIYSMFMIDSLSIINSLRIHLKNIIIR